VAQHRHKRETNARKLRAAHVAAPLAVVATLSAVTMGVLSAAPTSGDDLMASSTTASVSNAALERREITVSRSQLRTARQTARQTERKEQARAERQATRRAVRNADAHLWTTADLNVWDAAADDATKVGLLDAVKKVLVTGRRDNGRAEVVIDGTARWVSVDYLVKEKPEEGPSLGGQCTNGSSVSAGRATISQIHNVVCANWPQITSYGTWRNDGSHGQGRAIDIMVSGQTGWDVANFLRDNYSTYGIEYIIYAQHIWSVDRAGEGWRGMSNRGSVTANHFDHVHVTVY
jgi:hypothetical protein